MLADKRYCYPLTITDFASRYLIACEALATTKEAYAFTVFERAFKEFGLPAGSGASLPTSAASTSSKSPLDIPLSRDVHRFAHRSPLRL
jgi:hypothetical protein